MGKTSQTRNQLKKHDLPTSGLQRMSFLIDALELDGEMHNHMPTLDGVFVGCLYNVYINIRPLIPRSSPHSCAKQKTQGLLRRETHQSDLGPEQGISRSHASVTGHPGRIDVALPRTAVWVRVIGSFVRQPGLKGEILCVQCRQYIWLSFAYYKFGNCWPMTIYSSGQSVSVVTVTTWVILTLET